MKRKLALLLAALLLSAAAGCGEAAPAPSGPGVPGGEPSASSANEGGESEATELLFVNTLFTVSEDEAQTFYNSPVYAELRERTGVELKIRGADADQAAIYFASGDLGDITNIRSQADIASLAESEVILPLDGLVAEYGNNIRSSRPERWEMAQKQLSVDGKPYVLPVRAGSEGHMQYVSNSIFLIRWDWYAELGHPEVKNEDQFLAVLADMYKAHPQTAEGLPTYPVGFYVTTTDLGPFYRRYIQTYGYRDLSTTPFLFDVDNGGAILDVYNDPIETFSGSDEPLYFAAAKYYNKAHRQGLLDPDSFTQQAADYTGKCGNGQYLSGWWRSQADVYTLDQLKKDPESRIGYEVIPIEGMTVWADSVQAAGWEQFFLAIPSNAKNPEKSMQFIDYLYSQEGCRLAFSGIEGEHWNVVDGEPVWTDEVVAAKKAGGDAWAKYGIYFGPALYLLGLGNAEIYEKDGGPVDLAKGADYYKKCLLPVDEDFCEYYNVSYPIETILNLKKEGKANTHESLDMRVISSIGSAPEEISLILTAINKTAAEAVPSLVTAASDEEFAARKAALMAELNAQGLPAAVEWYKTRYDEVRKDFGY